MDLNFSLHAKQREVFVSDARIKVCAAGRRGGKSYLSAITLLIQGLKNENRYGTHLNSMCEVWYVAPTYQQGRDIIWNMLKELGGWGTPSSVIKTIHENTSTMALINGRVIKVKGSDRPDTLRGNSLSYVVMDEYAPSSGMFVRLVERVASADIGRRVWEPLRELSSDYEEEDVSRRRNLGNHIMMASGAKP